MAIAPWAVKGLIGLGGISAVSVGGIAIHQSYSSKGIKSPDKPTSNENKTQLGWRVETENKDDSIIISVIKSEPSKEWICQIKTTKPTDANKPEGIIPQIKEKLGIKDDGSIDEGKKGQLEKFVKNCERYKTGNQQNGGSKTTMDLGSIALDTTGSNYKLNDKEFSKTFGEIYMRKEYRESLGLPTDCKILEDMTSSSCELDANDLKKIRFEGKTNNTQTDLEGDKKVTLKIEQREGETFPRNLRFVFIAKDKDVTVSSGSDDSNPIDLVKSTYAEFKVKTNGNINTLERTKWDLSTLAKKVGLTCSGQDPSKTCTLGNDKKINVWNSNDSYIIGATFTGSISVAKDQQNYNQGFKFTTTCDIALTEASGINEPNKKGSDWKIENGSSGYEIKLKDIPDATKPTWFLSKASAS